MVHWLVRVAERAGLEGERPDVPPETPAKEAWPVVTRTYKIGDPRLCLLVATYFRLDVADFAMRDPNAPLLVPEAMSRRHHVFPLYETDRRLLVATCDPTQVEAERALGFSTGRTIVFQVSSPDAIQDVLDDRFSPEQAIETLLDDFEVDVDVDAVELVEEMGPEVISSADAAATPVVKLTNLIIRDAIAQSASDIHIEPGRWIGVVRYRVDGVLRKHMDLPMTAMNRVISRIKILARLDIADRLRPQDGKAHVRVQKLSYDLRVSTQDPDIILIGEIRDVETAETASHAAMTGHLVLATVHANDAVSAVARMADMGLPYATIGTTLRGAIAQRLLRRVCASCAESVRGDLTPEEQRLTEQHEVEPVVRAVGCKECGFTGYKGRIPVNEVMLSGPRFQAAVEARKGWQTLHRVAIQGGMRPIHQVALDWVAQGKTTLVEVDRALGRQTTADDVEEDVGPTRILVVDDDEEARLMAASILEAEGYEVSIAKDGYEAVERLDADPDFNLVILDLSMPGMDGRKVLDRIRGSKDTAALPVLVSTAFGGEEVETELLEAGADDFLEKTGDAKRFLARVKAVLRRAVM